MSAPLVAFREMALRCNYPSPPRRIARAAHREGASPPRAKNTIPPTFDLAPAVHIRHRPARGIFICATAKQRLRQREGKREADVFATDCAEAFCAAQAGRAAWRLQLAVLYLIARPLFCRVCGGRYTWRLLSGNYEMYTGMEMSRWDDDKFYPPVGVYFCVLGGFRFCSTGTEARLNA